MTKITVVEIKKVNRPQSKLNGNSDSCIAEIIELYVFQ